LSRVLLLGTLIGVKGQQLDDSTPDRVSAIVATRAASDHAPSIIVDGGIRKHTVPLLAARGADGVIPGSLVYGDTDPRRAIAEIRELTPGRAHQPLSDFWTDKAAP
jgi:ribulose-phosphate 3-epimerase